MTCYKGVQSHPRRLAATPCHLGLMIGKREVLTREGDPTMTPLWWDPDPEKWRMMGLYQMMM